MPNKLTVKHVSPSLFLATKFEAFADRGKGDYFSHDLEDIVFLLENRAGLVDEIRNEDSEVKRYLSEQAGQLLNDKFFNVLLGLLENEDSTESIIKLLREICAP